MNAHIVIAGGGVLGLSVALHASRKFDPLTHPVLLLDRGHLGAGSSIKSGGVLSAVNSEREYAGMARDSLRTYRDLGRLTGRTVGYRNTGVLTIVGPRQQAKLDDLRKRIETQRSIGISVREIGAEGIRLLCPGAVVEEGTIAAFEPDGGIVDPKQTLEVFATLARSAGATVRMGSEIKDLIIEGGRVCGVRSSRGDIATERVVLTAGPWTQSLLRRFDIETNLRTLRPAYLYLSMPGNTARAGEDSEDLFSTDYRRKDELGLLSSPDVGRDLDEEIEMRYGSGQEDEVAPAHPVIYDLEHDFYAKPDPQFGRTRLSRLDSTIHPDVESPDNYDDTVSAELQHDLRARLERRLPDYAAERLLGTDTNVVCAMSDGRAVIGELGELPGLYVISGFMGRDFNLAPSVGEGVAQMLAGDPISAFTPSFFSPERLTKTAGARG